LTWQADRLLFGSKRVLTHIVLPNGRAETEQHPYRSIARNNASVYTPEQATLICTGPIHLISYSIINLFKNVSFLVKVNNQLDAPMYAVLLPEHVSGTNMPIIRSNYN
jgi:hypothetical protein